MTTTRVGSAIYAVQLAGEVTTGAAINVAGFASSLVVWNEASVRAVAVGAFIVSGVFEETKAPGQTRHRNAVRRRRFVRR